MAKNFKKNGRVYINRLLACLTSTSLILVQTLPIAASTIDEDAANLIQKQPPTQPAASLHQNSRIHRPTPPPPEAPAGSSSGGTTAEPAQPAPVSAPEAPASSGSGGTTAEPAQPASPHQERHPVLVLGVPQLRCRPGHPLPPLQLDRGKQPLSA